MELRPDASVYAYLRELHGDITGAPLGPAPALGEGVNFNIGAEDSNLTTNGIYTIFSFLAAAHNGKNRRHIDCNEPSANPC